MTFDFPSGTNLQLFVDDLIHVWGVLESDLTIDYQLGRVAIRGSVPPAVPDLAWALSGTLVA